MKKETIIGFGFINLLFIWYSLVGIFSKNAAQYKFLSVDYIKWYCGVIFIMGVYAVLWQQAIKNFPLTVAYANKSIVTVWSILWGMIFWGEKLTLGKVLGTLIIVVGIVLVVMGENNDAEV